MTPLVDPAWLAGVLGAPDLVVLDATFYLPDEGRDAEAEFAAAHIPGARRFDVDAVSDDATDLPHMVPSPGRFARLVGALGIDNASRVVFYDQKGMFSAPRGWWLMGLFGHDRAAVLDGGLPLWRAEGRPVESGPPAPVAPRRFQPAFRAGWLRGVGDLLPEPTAGGRVILDARAASRFAGTAPEPRPGVMPGHIPGSRNLPFTELVAGGRLLPPDALRARFAAAGAGPESEVVTSCGSGVTAAVLSLGLRLAGLKQGALYDGSWAEWGSRDDTPKAREG